MSMALAVLLSFLLTVVVLRLLTLRPPVSERAKHYKLWQGKRSKTNESRLDQAASFIRFWVKQGK